ncbi:MAG: MarR family transcriptional regulator [Pseudomonadota bacterium]
MTDQMDENERLRRAVSDLLRIFLINERVFPSAEGRIPYSPHVFKAIGMLAGAPMSRASDLQTHLGLAPTTASSVIKRLVAQGWVRRAPHPEDGRAVALSLTEEGEALYAAIHRQDLVNMELLLSAFEGEEREVFISMIERAADRVREAAEAVLRG